MKDFVIINDKEFFDIGNNQRIYVFCNVYGYEERISSMFENKMHLQEIENIIKSWGGSMEIYFLNDLIKNYKKNKPKGLPF